MNTKLETFYAFVILWMCAVLVFCNLKIIELREMNKVLHDQLHQMVEKGIRLP